jgi:hypothetical protein
MPTLLARKYAAILPIRLIRVPIELSPMIEVVQWHRAHDRDPAHLWLRAQLKASVAQLERAAAPAPRTTRISRANASHPRKRFVRARQRRR